MCHGFSGFYHKSGKVFFIEPDEAGNISHHEVLERIPTKYKDDTNLIPFEFPYWTIKSFSWDTYDIPEWAYKEKCIDVFIKVEPLWLKCKKMIDDAFNLYMTENNIAWNNYQNMTWSPKNFGSKSHSEYIARINIIWKEYRKKEADAFADLIEELSKIDGYLKEKT